MDRLAQLHPTIRGVVDAAIRDFAEAIAEFRFDTAERIAAVTFLVVRQQSRS